MGGTLLARRYAKALADVVTKEGNFDEVSQDLKGFSSVLESNVGLQSVLYNPSIHLSHKKGLLEEVVRMSKPLSITSRFLTLLLEKGRLRNLSIIALAFEEISHQILNRVRVTATTAWQLSSEERENLIRRLQEITGGKEILLTLQVDPTLIGGIVIQIGNTIYDGSIQRQLENLKEELTRR